MSSSSVISANSVSELIKNRRSNYVLSKNLTISKERVAEIVRAFRAYRPFVFAGDREQNDAAHRRVVATFRAARDGHPGVASA